MQPGFSQSDMAVLNERLINLASSFDNLERKLEASMAKEEARRENLSSRIESMSGILTMLVHKTESYADRFEIVEKRISDTRAMIKGHVANDETPDEFIAKKTSIVVWGLIIIIASGLFNSLIKVIIDNLVK